MSNNLEEEIRAVLSKMDNNESQDNAQTPPDEIQDIYVFVVRERDDEIVDNPQVVDSSPVPVTTQQDSFLSAYIFVCFSLFLILSTLTFQLYSLYNPAIATVTIIPKAQQLTLSGTLQLGRVLQPITISQSQTVATTGRGHQDAKAATGFITFYNGSFTPQTVDAGTIYTGSDGIQVMTNEIVTIPAAAPGNPPQFGYAAIGATAIQIGSRGNIPAGDISITGTTLQVSNSQFHNGQDERSYQTVTRSDVTNAASMLKSSLALSIQGALEGQLKPTEQLSLLPCSPTVTPNRNVGDEATTLKVIVSLTCSAVAYNTKELENKATALLSSKAQSKLSGYRLFGDIKISVQQTTITHNLVFLSFKATATWVYGLSSKAQELIKKEIEGKTKDQALKLLADMPGIERSSINWGDDTRLPKGSSFIHIKLFVM